MIHKAGNKKNIRRILDRADAVDINEGRLAYWRYHEVLRRLAEYYGVPFPKAIAAFIALSPNNDYLGNLRSAASVMKGFAAGVDVNYIRVSCYNHCRDRAYSYLDGVDFLATSKGKKIRAFYSNILNPMDPGPVTVDGHAVNVWRGSRETLKLVVVGRGFRYDDVANDYRSTAADVGLLPNQVQSITWFAWKRIHGILYPGRQLELFSDNSADLWKTLRDPETIRPFPFLTEPSYSTLNAKEK